MGKIRMDYEQAEPPSAGKAALTIMSISAVTLATTTCRELCDFIARSDSPSMTAAKTLHSRAFMPVDAT
jgi:hypothetical protein